MPEATPFTFDGVYDGFPAEYDGSISPIPSTRSIDISSRSNWTTLSGVNKDNVGTFTSEQLQAKIAESHALACAWLWNLYKVNVSIYGGFGSSMSDINTREHARDFEGNVLAFDPSDKARMIPTREETDEGVLDQMQNVTSSTPFNSQLVRADVGVGNSEYYGTVIDRFYNGSDFVGYGFSGFGGVDCSEADGDMSVAVRGYDFTGLPSGTEVAYCEIPITNSTLGPFHGVCLADGNYGQDAENMRADSEVSDLGTTESTWIQILSVQTHVCIF